MKDKHPPRGNFFAGLTKQDLDAFDKAMKEYFEGVHIEYVDPHTCQCKSCVEKGLNA